LKATSLPLDVPAPEIRFEDTDFCFTGTFAYGCRDDCDRVVENLGGRCGSLTLKTDFLVIGIYATGSWIHSPYGRKIERAVEMKEAGDSIRIVGEQHWSKSINVARP
jgi:NAD-dependent DNA ligase